MLFSIEISEACQSNLFKFNDPGIEVFIAKSDMEVKVQHNVGLILPCIIVNKDLVVVRG